MERRPDALDRALRSDLTRRRVLQGLAASGAAAFLVACGTPGTRSGTPGATGTPSATRTPGASPSGAIATGTPVASTAPASELPATDGPEPTATEEPQATRPTVTGEFRWANWIGYIDKSRGTFPTLERFTNETGITIDYQEAVDDNETFYTADLEGPLSVGQPSGWDLVVLTDWMVQRLVERGWLDEIDTSWMTNYPANLGEAYRQRPWDPENRFAAPWQSGMTGIAYDRAATGELTSVAALWDPQYAGRVFFLSEMRDTVGLAALKVGLDPSTLDQAGFDQALAEVRAANDAGQVRGFVGNRYVNALATGDVVLAIGWSGDVLGLLVPDQQGDQDFQFLLPEEGGMLWTDNMVIPKGAQNKQQAELWIDFYYQPDVAATVEAWVNYLCPVAGAEEAMIELDPGLAENPLIFPTDDMVARLHDFAAVDLNTAQAWEEAFNDAIGL